MKKYLLFVLAIGLAFAACQKDLTGKIDVEEIEKTITLDEAITMKQKLSGIMPETAKNTVNIQSGSPAIQTTASCPSYPHIVSSFGTSTTISTFGDNQNKGGGTALIRKLKKGRSYQITFSYASEATYVRDQYDWLENFPKLQVGFANDSDLNTVCANSVNLTNLNIPSANVQPTTNYNLPGPTVINYSSRTIMLVADECYDYVWFNVLPVSGKYRHDFKIRNLSITEIGDDFQLQQTGSLANGGQSTFKVMFNGFQIAYNFEWTTTGNLVIEGSNVGSTVNVKASNGSSYAGKVIASIPGCGVFAEFSVDNCSNGSDKKFINGGCETGVRACTRSVPTGTSNQFGPLYTTHFDYMFSDGSTNYGGSSVSNRMCATSD